MIFSILILLGACWDFFKQSVLQNFTCSVLFRKGRGSRDQNCQHLLDHRESKGIFKKNCSCFIDYAKALTTWITTNCGKFLKRWHCQNILPVSWETCMRVKRQQLEPHMEQLTGSELRKEYDEAVNCLRVY